jgi:hypothetical protein
LSAEAGASGEFRAALFQEFAQDEAVAADFIFAIAADGEI